MAASSSGIHAGQRPRRPRYTTIGDSTGNRRRRDLMHVRRIRRFVANFALFRRLAAGQSPIAALTS